MSPSILIVKTSSLGDIVQSFHILSFIHQIFPKAKIDWIVEKKFFSIVAAHPLINRAILIDREKPFFSFFQFRKKSYDFLFDLQGNSKSGLITFFAKANIKIGFSSQSVREWPNILSTHFRFHVPKEINIRLQYLSLISQFYEVPVISETNKVLFKMSHEEIYFFNQMMKDEIFTSRIKIMVCPGSQWKNKQVSLQTMSAFLFSLQKKLGASFLLMWGNEQEKQFCQEIQDLFPDNSKIIDKLSFSMWQNLMSQMDLVVAVDSSALHLCGMTHTPSFSIFGPTSPEIFKPIGNQHFSFQGACPYGKTFHKRCPILRSCSTGGCIKNICPDELFSSFSKWWDRLFSNSITS